MKFLRLLRSRIFSHKKDQRVVISDEVTETELGVGRISDEVTDNELDQDGVIFDEVTENEVDYYNRFGEVNETELDCGSFSNEVTENELDHGIISDEVKENDIHHPSIFDEVNETELDYDSISDEFDTDRFSDDMTEELQQLDLAPLDAFFEFTEAIDKSSFDNLAFPREFDDLAFLREFVKNPLQGLGRDLSERIVSLLCDVVSIISGYDLTNITPEEASELTSRLPGRYGKPWLLVAAIRNRWRSKKNPNSMREYYPKDAQLGFVEHLLENLEQLVTHKSHSIRLLKPNILILKDKLQDLRSRLMDIPPSLKEDEDIKAVIQSTSDLAYDTEYAIDSSLVEFNPIWYANFLLDDILEELHTAESNLELSLGKPKSIVRLIIQDHIEEPHIIPILHNPQELDTISGRSGTSNKVSGIFDDSLLFFAFHIRTWCLVSSYKERKREVFLQLLDNAEYGGHQFRQVVNKSNVEMSEDELKREVYKLLDYKKYVVILEDVREIDALFDIVNTLPKNNFCRVLVITPSAEVATKCRNFHKREDILDQRAEDRTMQINKPTIDNDVVGFATETERMLERLTGESQQLCIISIVGMAGQGKSTLAMKLYNNALISDHFDTSMWCYVSQIYEKKGLLVELLGQVIQLSESILDKDDEELAEMLYKHLKGRRFFVFLDDVWTVEVWNDLRRCFPNDNNGSRIVFTTRIEELASQTNSMASVQQLLPLSPEESWELLKKKVFQEDSCPEELLEVGKKIAESCKGLPLSVVVIAGFLKNIERSADKWERIGNTLSSRILSVGAQGRNIIEMSYKHLPDHLRPCFLYFGAFLEDREISVSKLIRLWIAEGFIKRTDLKILEDVAEGYLTDLIGRNLVTISQKKSNGGVKLCRVHDLLHEFCVTKAREDNFLQHINGYDEQFSSSSHYLRRLCIRSEREQFFMLDAYMTPVRSLFFFAISDLGSSSSYNISFIVCNFKLVTILDLEDIKIGDSFEEINLLAHLRYLAVQCYIDSIPSSIANLWNLETFIFKGLSSKIVKVPYSIWNMEKLRHIHISDSASFDLTPDIPQMPSILKNLQTFSTPSLACGDDMLKLLGTLQGIRKLKCIFLDSCDDVGNCNQLPELNFLGQLVSLRVYYNGEVRYPRKFNLPPNLKKLSLSNFHMPWDALSQLAALCNLEVLKLEDNAFDGETWEMEDEVFPKLKYLKLDNLNVVEWSASNDHFPRLENLCLHRCEKLEEIPLEIGDIATLKMIEVMWCSPSVATSAKRIQEEQQEYSNEELRIHVHPKLHDYKLL